MASRHLIGSICNMLGIVGLAVGGIMLYNEIQGSRINFNQGSAMAENGLPWLIAGAVLTIIGAVLKKARPPG